MPDGQPPIDPVPILLGAAAVGAAGIGLFLLLQRPPTPELIQTLLTIAASPSLVEVGQPATISGVLQRTDTGQGIPGQAVVIEQSLDQLVWQALGTVNTAADGSYAIQLTFPAAGLYYIRSRYAGGPAS